MLFAELLNGKRIWILWELVPFALQAKDLQFETSKVCAQVGVIANCLFKYSIEKLKSQLRVR